MLYVEGTKFCIHCGHDLRVKENPVSQAPRETMGIGIDYEEPSNTYYEDSADYDLEPKSDYGNYDKPDYETSRVDLNAPRPSINLTPETPPHFQPQYAPSMEIKSQYSRVTAALLAIFLGGIGVHKFYLNKTVQGVLYIALAVTGISIVLGFIEGIRFLCLSNEHFDELSLR